MSKSVVKIEVKAVLPTNGGSAVFLGNEEKAFVIYIDDSIGAAITMAMRQVPRERPQTHELIAAMLKGLGAKVERVVINDMHEGVFFARIILSMENELHQRKIVELDARPSDSIAIATQVGAPVYVSDSVWDNVADMSEMLKRVQSGTQGHDDPMDLI